jgi:hypothetical protein
MRPTILIALAIALTGCAARRPEPAQPAEPPQAVVPPEVKAAANPDRTPSLCLVDSQVADCDTLMTKLLPDTVEKIEVVKGYAALERYGPRAVNGVIVVQLKK